MSAGPRVGIAGTGSFMPERVVPNSEFEKHVDTSDAWIVERTGIRERRFVSPGENTSDLSLRAAENALAAANIDAGDIDLIIVGTLTPDQLLPSVACQVQHRLGSATAVAFDLGSACTGFLNALQTAETYVAAGRAKRALAIGAETLSRYLDMTDRDSCIIFGDGAGAAVVSRWEDCEQGELLRGVGGSDGSGYELIQIPMGGTARPHDHSEYDKREHYIRIRGREVYRFAVEKMTAMIQQVTSDVDLDDVALIVPHQVNARIIDSSLERLGIGRDRCMVNIDRYGNTSAASVPVALDEAVREGRVKKGDLVVLVAFGAGLTWAASLVRW